jgi:WD repeat-containing protein 35
MISLYSSPALTGNDKEEWIRKQALLVLIYEAIVAQMLDYDYAPSSTLINDRRVFFNKSQEGHSDVDFLREEDLLNGLKLASNTYQPVTCYQISKKGLELAKKVPKADKEAIHEVVYVPKTRELLRVQWREGNFYLVGSGTYERKSTVLICEDVSYVGSAYVPQCLRVGGRPTISNAHRAAECAVAASNLRDELDEVITLNSISIVIAEFIPFGANQIVQMNTTLGSTERVQGGFFTALIDSDSAGTKFVVDPGLTSVNILDYTMTKHVNFEAEIKIPEESGIIQVEAFGVSMNADGTMFYGMQVEAVMDRIKDNVSLDTLSRLLVDVAIDSSTIVDSILSSYQRKLLTLIFGKDAANRDKVNLIIANEITPHLTAEEYMDKGEYENELKQVIGDTRAAFDVSEHDTLIFGASGLLIAGPNARQHEPLLCSYLQFTSVDLYIRNFFNRMFLLNDAMASLRKVINTYTEDPLSMSKIYEKMQILSDDARLLSEVLGYMAESLESCEIPPEPLDVTGRALYARLQIADLAGQLSMRVLDLKKTMEGVRQELSHLRHLTEVVFETKQFAVHESVQHNTRQLIMLNETSQIMSATLKMLLLIFTGTLAFEILDRITGDWTVMDQGWFQDFADPMVRKFPVAWFVFSMVTWGAVALGSMRLLNFFVYVSAGIVTMRVRIMQRLVMDRFNLYLSTKNMVVEERQYDEKNTVVLFTWEETLAAREYGGSAPRITVEYDRHTSFMLAVIIEYNRRAAKKTQSMTGSEVRNKICEEMISAGIFDDKFFTFAENVRIVSEDELRDIAATEGVSK